MVLAAAVTVVAGAALLVSRRAVGRAAERSWKLQARVYEAFGDVLEGRLEIVAAGRRRAFLAELRVRTRAWGAAGARVAVATVLSGRLGLVAVAGLVSAALLLNTRNPLDGSDENLFALNRMLRRSGEAPAPRFSFSFRLASSLTCECALLVTKIPKPHAKVLKPVTRHFSDSGMMGIANDFLLVVFQNAVFKLAGSRHRILLIQGSIRKTRTSNPKQ